jgi:hypothetical protein
MLALDGFWLNATLPLLITKEGSMQLLTQELRASLPRLYAQDGNSDPTVHAKFFTPDSNWTWFITEGGPEEDDYIFFGYVIGQCEEWGYSALSDLESVRGGLGLPIERDLHFRPGPWSEVIARYRHERGEQG